MAIQQVQIKTITTSPTTLSGLNTLSVLNGSSSNSLTIGVDGSGETITLDSGQTLTLNAYSGFILPDIVISGTSLSAQVVYS
jgi:hypothetical protein